MRVPWYLCVFVCLSAIGLTYWLGTRDYDFVTAPEQPASYQTEAATEEKKIEHQSLAPQTAPDLQLDPQPQPEIVVTLPESQIDDYLELSDFGADGYAKLAKKLVAEKHPEHSLVAWERLLDSSAPSNEQIKEAHSILKLHKPLTKPDQGKIAIAITLHASVPSDMLEKMTSILNVSAAIIEEGSGFALDITTEIHSLPIKKAKPRPAVSLWFSGKNETARGNFRTKHPSQLGMAEKVNTSLFNLVTPFLEQNSQLTPIQRMHPEINAQETLTYLITRHSWREFARLLYTELNSQ